jgi:TATA-box binding protein (TBP) (component of TFIID and TFIIIB)
MQKTSQMQLSDFVGQPCKSRLAFEFIPKKEAKLDLENIARLLRSNDVFVETETHFLLMLNIAGKNCTLFRTGKIIVKETKEMEKAREVAERLVEKIGKEE